MAEHTLKAFDTTLGDLRRRISELGGLAEKTEVNRNPPADRKPCMTCSRFRSGTCELSARWLRWGIRPAAGALDSR